MLALLIGALLPPPQLRTVVLHAADAAALPASSDFLPSPELIAADDESDGECDDAAPAGADAAVPAAA